MDGDPLTYSFELDRVNTFDSAARITSAAIPEGAAGTTSWQVTDLTDNSRYFWRVKASDGAAESPWVMGSFFVNTANDPPTAPTLKNPGQGAWVRSLTPALELNAASDVDEDVLHYQFELYADAALTQLVAQGDADHPQWVVPLMLTDNTWYFWRARAVDEHGAESPWMTPSVFFIDYNGVNDPPQITLLQPATDLYLHNRHGSHWLAGRRSRQQRGDHP